MQMKSLMAMLMVLLLPLAAMAATARLVRNDTLRDRPFTDGKALVSMKSGGTVEVIKREGAWYQVKAGTRTGWLPMLSVRQTSTASVASAGSLSAVASGRAGTGTVVATTGVRGLNEEALREATFSEEAVAGAEKYRITAGEAKKYARAAGLKVRNVPPLPEGKKK